MSLHRPTCKRRYILKLFGLSTIGIWLQAKGTEPITQSRQMTAPSNIPGISYENGKYILPALPYAYNALEPLMDEETVRLHHDKHHASYVTGANAAAEKLQEIAAGTLDASATTHWVRSLSFNLSGHILHTLFWNNMTPTPKSAPEGPLAEAIVTKFGSLEAMLKIFKAAALGVEGSGWGILGLDPISYTLIICGVEKHQNIEAPGLIPLLACDVWEHAYYLKHQNLRANYIEDFCKLINWDDVENRYLLAMGK